MNEKLGFRLDEVRILFADRDWWREAGSVVGLDLRGWTFRREGQFVDATTGVSVHLPGSVAERLIAIRRHLDWEAV